jgi:PAS domain-containing protein
MMMTQDTAPLILSECASGECTARMEEMNERIGELVEENVRLKRLEDVVNRNNALFEALVMNGNDGIALTGPDRRILKIVRGLTGFDTNSLPGAFVDAVAIPEDRPIVVEAYRQLLSGSCKSAKIEIRLRRADSRVVLHSATLTDMLDNPNVQGIVWNYRVSGTACPDV